MNEMATEGESVVDLRCAKTPEVDDNFIFRQCPEKPSERRETALFSIDEIVPGNYSVNMQLVVLMGIFRDCLLPMRDGFSEHRELRQKPRRCSETRKPASNKAKRHFDHSDTSV